jgi:hypothetical protein
LGSGIEILNAPISSNMLVSDFFASLQNSLFRSEKEFGNSRVIDFLAWSAGVDGATFTYQVLSCRLSTPESKSRQYFWMPDGTSAGRHGI